MSYEFLSEFAAMDYLDAMYNDGELYDALVEDHLYGVYAEEEGERKEGAWTPADQVADEFCVTWNQIELLPVYEGKRQWRSTS